MQLAESLESADSRTFVYVDDSGRVRPAWRYRAIQLASWSLLFLLSAAVGLVLALLGGWVGFGLALVLVAVVVHLALLSSWLSRGIVLLAHEELDLAEALLARADRFAGFQLGIRALALQNRSALAQRRGNHALAFELGERALALRDKLPAMLGRGLHHWLLRYAQVILLCNLGRTDEARHRLERTADPPDGEYIRLRRWTAELYLALVSERLELDRAELETRTARAAEIRSSPELIALVAWAWHSLGDGERALSLARTANELEESSPFSESLPALGHWLNALLHDPRTPAPDPPGDSR
jgi:tetratricopeptide (TPR) repeat protein